MKRTQWIVVGSLTLISATSLTVFQNCAPSQFRAVDPVAKAEVLGTTPVLGQPDLPPGTNPPVTNPPPTTPPGSNPPPVVTNPPTVPVKYVCSRSQSTSVGYTLLSEPNLVLSLKKSGQVSCSFSATAIRNRILNEKKIAITDIAPNCPSLAAGNYTFSLHRASDASGRALLSSSLTVNADSSMVFFVAVGNNTLSSGQPIDKQGIDANLNVLYDTNISTGVTAANDPCDYRASPLVVQLRAPDRAPAAISLTAPTEGIQYDILGRNSQPYAHAKKQISWFTHDSAEENHFIALPNEKGEVNGIDELFGDNTFGPDRDFSANGYAALAKYDGRREDGSVDLMQKNGYINRADEIFHRLRLWKDINGDGLSQANELSTLSEKHIDTIDLNFDTGFSETDRYGNQTKMKSVVRTDDGKLHLLYDLWFRYL